MTPPRATAADLALAAVAEVRDDPTGRLRAMRGLYESRAPGAPHLPYRRAITAFMTWQLGRGLLAPPSAPRPGSPWWRAVNDALLRDTAEARHLSLGAPGEPSSPAARACLEFALRPSAQGWYRAHNASIVASYLANRGLAEREGRVERFFLNVVLLRVLYAHALVSAPRLALGRLRPLGPALGDPRLGTTGIFLSLSRVLPNAYPLGEDVTPFVAAENGFGRLLDFGVIQPRLRALYDWSAQELGQPALAGLLADDVPAYAWPPGDGADWHPPLRALARIARRVLPPPG